MGAGPRLDHWTQVAIRSRWTLPLALLVGAIIEITVPASFQHRTAALLAAPFITVPLAWRRVRPVPVALVVCGAMAVQSFAGVKTNAELTAFVAILSATYAAGRYATVAESIVVIIGVGCVLGAFAVTSTQAVGDAAFVGFFVLSSYLLGRAVQLHTMEARRQAGRAALAEVAGEERAREAIEAERQRIARELHDVVAHAVSLMVVQAGAADAVLASEPGRARLPLATIQQVGRDALVDMHHLLGLLRGPSDSSLVPDPTLAVLPRLVDELNGTGLVVSLDVVGDPAACPASIGVSGYRVVREALTNSLRHAGAVAVRVRVEVGADRLDVDVHDEGVGPYDETPAGYGLVGMRERVAVFGGRFDAGPDPRGGYRVHAQIPYDVDLAGAS